MAGNLNLNLNNKPANSTIFVGVSNIIDNPQVEATTLNSINSFQYEKPSKEAKLAKESALKRVRQELRQRNV